MTPLESLRDLAARAGSNSGEVRLSLEGDIAWIRLDSPQVHNALSTRMMVQLGEAIEALQTFEGRAVVLGSTTPGMFCSGGHLDEVQRALIDPAAGRQMAEAMGAILDRLLSLSLVSVAALDGPAIGGGAELATACDFRVARSSARLHFVQAGLGVATGWGGAGRLVTHLGRRAALRLLTEARALTAAEAQALGLVDLVCEGPAEEGALRLLERLRTLPAAAVRAVKAQVADPSQAAHHFGLVWGGPAHLQALAATRGNKA